MYILVVVVGVLLACLDKLLFLRSFAPVERASNNSLSQDTLHLMHQLH